MKILICYFSGTGNTKRVVDEYVSCLTELGESTELYNIELGGEISPTQYDMLGIAYPIWAFNAPGIVLDFVKRLKKVETPIPAFILKTSGEALALNNASSDKLKSLLKKKGFTLTNEYHYLMPYNIIFRHTDGMAHRMWTAVKWAVPADCRAVVEHRKQIIKSIPFGRPITAVLRVQQWGGRFNGKRYKVTDECVHCGRCVKACPVHNIIDENGKLKFGKKCLMCMRCAFECPKDAIRIGWFDGWRVNGAYHFDKPYEDGENAVGVDKKHVDYCRKSYEKYFETCKEKAASLETGDEQKQA